jgi:hypothetical protein
LADGIPFGGINWLVSMEQDILIAVLVGLLFTSLAFVAFLSIRGSYYQSLYNSAQAEQSLLLAMSDMARPVPAKGSQVYRHFKGGRYELVSDMATIEGTKDPVVVYRSLQDTRVWVRPISSWQEVVTWPDGALRPRFTLESDLTLLPA